MIKCFVGPMYSGKSSTMLSIYKRMWNKDSILVFKPKIDNREYGVLKSRDFDEEIKAICIENLDDILNYIDDEIKVIFIDEVQFLKGNVQTLNMLSIENDIDIYLSGLDMTSEQEPFGIIGDILAISDEVVKIKATCYFCNKSAEYTYYQGKKNDTILVGSDKYIPLCRNCLLRNKNKKS